MDDAKKLIGKLASLSRLELAPDEIERLAEQLPKILEYVGQLRQVKTDAVAEPTPVSQPPRADVAQPSSATKEILDQAPAKREQYWQVDSVFAHD